MNAYRGGPNKEKRKSTLLICVMYTEKAYGKNKVTGTLMIHLFCVILCDHDKVNNEFLYEVI